MTTFAVDDKVRLKSDRSVLMVVTRAPIIPDRKQEKVECQREDNGDVREYWTDQIEKR